MTREDAIKMLEYIRHTGNGESEYKNDAQAIAIDMAIKALEEKQQPCEDCVSRQAAIEVVRKWFDKIQFNGDICLDGIISLPSVTPQPKTGRWIRIDKDKLRCSECEVIHLIAQYPNGKIDWCPNCGAKMESEVEE